MFEFIYPPRCFFCNKLCNTNICDDCIQAFHPQLPECFYCRRISSNSRTHTTNRLPRYKRLKKCLILFTYNTHARKLMYAYKFKNEHSNKRAISKLIRSKSTLIRSTLLGHSESKELLICPTPSHRSRRYARGFDHTQHIAMQLGHIMRKPVLNILRRNDRGTARTLSDKNKRIKIRPSFQIKDIGLVKRYKHIIIVDDVITTGETINQLVKLFNKTDLPQVSVFALFRGKPRYTESGGACPATHIEKKLA